MKCAACKEDIQPKFTFAISQNSCPFCGGEIMPEKLKVLLEDIRIIMDDAKEFPEETSEYLAVNYNLHHINQEEMQALRPQEGRLPNQASEQEMSIFAKRAGIKTFGKKPGNEPIKTMSDFKAVVNQIQNEDEDTYKEVDTDEQVLAQEKAQEQAQAYEMMPVDISENKIPIGRQEVSALNDIFSSGSINQANEVLEAEKLRQLRSRGGGNGKPITRSED